MTKTYRLTLQADADLQDIFLYTAKRWSINQAEIYLHSLEMHMQDLANGKTQGKSCTLIIWQNNSNNKDLLYSKVQKHYVIFRTIDAGVEILALYHASMDLDKHIKQLAKDVR